MSEPQGAIGLFFDTECTTGSNLADTTSQESVSVDEQPERYFSDANISVECTYRPGCIIDITVKVSPAACEAARQKAIKEIRKEVSLPGFRHGHVPTDIVIQHYGSHIEKHFREIVTCTAFEDAVKLVKRAPFAKNSIRKARVVSVSKDMGAEIQYEYESEPLVPTIDISQLNLEPVLPKPPSDEEVNRVYDWLLYSKSEHRLVEGRGPQEGDAVEVGISHKADGPFEPKTLYFRDKAIADWLYATIAGLNIGETKETLIPAQGTSQAMTVYVQLMHVYECIFPEQNDAFAQSVGEPSLELLRQHIRSRLEHDAQRAAQERMRRQVKNELIRLYAFDLPQSLVENETEMRFRPYLESLSTTQDPATVDKEALRKPFLEEVKRHLTCFLLFQPMFHDVKPSYSMRELTEELTAQTTKVAPAQCVIHGKMEEKEMYNRLLSNIVMRQCEDYCIYKRLGIAAPVLEQEKASEGTPQNEGCCHHEGETCHCQHEHEPSDNS
jgi:trigger factor